MILKKGLYLLFIVLGISLILAIPEDIITGDVVAQNVQSSIIIGEVSNNCSNNITEGVEECDWGVNNGVACSPPYGGSCQYCTVSCEYFTLNGDYCGDGTCNGAETSSSCSADCEGGGGGGGGGGGTGNGTVVTGPDFWVDKIRLDIEMEKGKYLQKQMILTNNGTEDLLINLSISPSLQRFILPETDIFVLKVKESRPLKFDIYGLESERADVYLGQINFDAEVVERSVDVVFDLKEKSSLFDMETKVVRKYVLPGNRVFADIIIRDLGEFGEISVDLEYSIRDFNNFTYETKKESFVMKDSFSKRVFLDTSNKDRMGDYIFYSKLVYGDISVSSYDGFVLEKISILLWVLMILIILVVIIIIIILIKKEREKRQVILAIRESKFKSKLK